MRCRRILRTCWGSAITARPSSASRNADSEGRPLRRPWQAAWPKRHEIPGRTRSLRRDARSHRPSGRRRVVRARGSSPREPGARDRACGTRCRGSVRSTAHSGGSAWLGHQEGAEAAGTGTPPHGICVNHAVGPRSWRWVSSESRPPWGQGLAASCRAFLALFKQGAPQTHPVYRTHLRLMFLRLNRNSPAANSSSTGKLTQRGSRPSPLIAAFRMSAP